MELAEALALYDAFVARLRQRLAVGQVVEFREVTQPGGQEVMFFVGTDFCVCIGGCFDDLVLFPEHDPGERGSRG